MYLKGAMLSTKPLPYKRAYIDSLIPEVGQNGAYMIYNSKLGYFCNTTDLDAELLRYLIRGIEIEATKGSTTIGKLVRAEFFWKHEQFGGPSTRGVVLYDNTSAPIVHVVHALLGYGGSGPALSEAILRYLGVPTGLFEQANAAVQHQDYVVVFSREHHTEIMSVDTAIPYAEPNDWEWWRER